MTDLRDTPVTAEELQLAKESQINSFVFGFENTHSVVSQQMSLAFFDYPANYLADYRDKIAAVTIAARLVTGSLRGLVARGLSGVRLVTSDAHPGLVDAIASTLPGTRAARRRALPALRAQCHRNRIRVRLFHQAATVDR